MQNICNFFVWGPQRAMLKCEVAQFPRGIKGKIVFVMQVTQNQTCLSEP